MSEARDGAERLGDRIEELVLVRNRLARDVAEGDTAAVARTTEWLDRLTSRLVECARELREEAGEPPSGTLVAPSLIVIAGGERFLLRRTDLRAVETIAVGDAGASEFIWRGRSLPLLSLAEQLRLGAATERPGGSEPPSLVVVLETEDRIFGVLVDAVQETGEVVVQPLGFTLRDLAAYSGATVLGDGRVALILDAAGLARIGGVGPSREESAEPAPPPASERSPQSFVLLESTRGDRLAIPLRDVPRLEEIRFADVEVGEGHRYVPWRGERLPLVDVGEILRERRGEARSPASPPDPAFGTVVVLEDAEGRVGIVFAAVLDIVDTVDIDPEETRDEKRRFVAFSAVIRGRLTEVLDVAAILRARRPDRPSSPGIQRTEA